MGIPASSAGQGVLPPGPQCTGSPNLLPQTAVLWEAAEVYLLQKKQNTPDISAQLDPSDLGYAPHFEPWPLCVLLRQEAEQMPVSLDSVSKRVHSVCISIYQCLSIPDLIPC